MNASRSMLAAITLGVFTVGCTQHTPPTMSPSANPPPEFPAPPSSNPTSPDTPNTNPNVPPGSPTQPNPDAPPRG
jgi:hypothetical protein